MIFIVYLADERVEIKPFFHLNAIESTLDFGHARACRGRTPVSDDQTTENEQAKLTELEKH
jgi:hypothetical protein